MKIYSFNVLIKGGIAKETFCAWFPEVIKKRRREVRAMYAK